MKIIYLEMDPIEMPGSLRKVELSRGIFFQPWLHILLMAAKVMAVIFSKVIFRTCVYTNLDSFYSK